MLLDRNRPRLGILGGGQLAKMLAQAAYQLGCRVHVLEQRATAEPLIGWPSIVGDWNDPETLVAFAKNADVVTLENEFIEAEALAALEAAGHRLYPTSTTMALVQDKYLQKCTLADAGLPVPEFRAVDAPEQVVEIARAWGWPLVLKRRTLGYDGKGNATIHAARELPSAWNKLGGDVNELYVERFCDFDRELALIVTRGRCGAGKSKAELAVYPVVDTVQRDHICHTVSAPARLKPELAEAAAEIGRRAVEAIDGVGSFGIELFLMPDERILVNEMAPRVHNSGHYSIEACHCSQFENHVRAVLGWPLGSPAMRAPAAAMVNLLGASEGLPMPAGLESALSIPGAHVHIYGKDRSAKGRKMGHVTALGDTPEEALALARRAADALRFG